MSEEEQAWLDKEVSRNLGSGSWVAATIKTHVTKCFLVPKKVEPGQPKKWRLVIDLRHLNDFCRDKSCKFETLKSLRYQCYAATDPDNDWFPAAGWFQLLTALHPVGSCLWRGSY